MLSNLTPYVIYALIALQILDIITTVIALRNPNAYESNWLIAPSLISQLIYWHFSKCSQYDSYYSYR